MTMMDVAHIANPRTGRHVHSSGGFQRAAALERWGVRGSARDGRDIARGGDGDESPPRAGVDARASAVSRAGVATRQRLPSLARGWPSVRSFETCVNYVLH